MGMDPYEERLLIALLGGGAALVALVTLLFVCFRKYRLDNKKMPGGQTRRQQQQQQLMHLQMPWQQASRQGQMMIYQPTGLQPTGGLALLEPGMLDPGLKANSSSTGGNNYYNPEQSLPHQPLIGYAEGNAAV